jgi:uncharacterized repeat protein (TIGR01451 family)
MLLCFGNSFSQTQTLGINQTSTGNPSNLCNGCYTITVFYSISNINATGTQIKCTVPNNIFDFCSYGGASVSTVGTTTTLTFNEGVRSTGSYPVSYSIKFKSGLACAGLTGAVNATIQTTQTITPVTSTPISLTSTGTEAWTVAKYTQYYGSGGWTGSYGTGNPNDFYVSNCNSTVDVTYFIRVSNGNGCINLSGASITDNLPANATVVDINSGAVPFTTGVGTVTFNIGNGSNVLDVATGLYDYYVHVTFPVSNIGQIKCNTATLKGTNACTSVLKTLASNTACIKLLALPPGNSCGLFGSIYDLDGNGINDYYIGCPAFLPIGLGFTNQCNPSSINYNNIGYSTPIPGQIHVDSFSLNAIPAGKTITMTVNTTCGPYTQTFTGPLAASVINFYAPPFNIPVACTISNFAITSNMSINGNNSMYFGTMHFTVLPTNWSTLAAVTVGSTVTLSGAQYTTSNGNFNCPQAFVISNKIAKIELIKTYCPPYKACFNENDTITYSLNIRNYGNANFVGGSIKDALPVGLQYVPNSSTYTIYNPLSLGYCNTTNQTGTGITVAHAENTATTNLQWNLPALNASCNAGSNWYVINFKAKITNMAPAGTITNSAWCYDGSNALMSETNPWNNSINLIVCERKLALQLIKEVSADSIRWDSCVSVVSGAPVYYRLKVTNPGNVPFTQIRMMDLLPNTSIAGSDVHLVNCNVRGSNIPIYLTNFLPLGNASTIKYSTNPSPIRSIPSALNIIPNTVAGCETAVTWGTPLLPAIQNQKSFFIDFATYSLGAGQTETFTYSAQVPPGALVGSVGWNSFGAVSTIQSVQTLGAESPKVCVNIIDSGCGCIGNFVWFDANNNGLQDVGEVGINGVTITLYNSSNVQIGLPHISTFDINNNPGYYSFCGLTAGTYYIVVTPPAGYMLTNINNTNNALNSDVNPNNNTSANIQFNCQTNNDIDVGLTLDDGCKCAQSTWGNISISNDIIIISNPDYDLQAKKINIGGTGPSGPLPHNGQSIKLVCKPQQEVITLQCKTTYNFAAAYNCSKPSCGSVQIVVTLPNGNTTTSTNAASFTTNDGGIYTVAIYGICGNKICDSCKFQFKVVCPICPCDPKLAVTATTKTITNVTSTPAYTLLSQNFTIATPPSMLYTQLRAEVVSFNLQSGFSNECISCKNLPYTWASIYNASNINTNTAVADSITMGTIPPVIQFTPALSNTHKNPRETIWSSYSGFTAPSTLNMQFILPPKSLISCCTLTGTICVKFTFRDRDCKECEVIVCFNFSIPPTNVIYDNPTGDLPHIDKGKINTNAMTTTDGCLSCGTTNNGNGNNGGEPLQQSQNSTQLLASSNGTTTLSNEEMIKALEEKIKQYKNLKEQGIKRGDVELLPIVEADLKQLLQKEKEKK